ncbi:uncharacterized protein LOC130625045 [Hydractinia symbiolongicarpus]|uniref:uncharacterized protein LOC130625045 n=1 Tax=Hydractinia symbiolongicarpus TaxID=13093 RepID=UPI00254C0019|nr:uncharacterized protein LOC130625045 [Hydractinia symbiolongicarpus]
MNNTLRQTIMKRSQLKNRVNETKNTSHIRSFNKQRNHVRAKGDANIILIENDKIIMENKDIAVIFNSFLENIVNSLGRYKWPIVPENEPSDEKLLKIHLQKKATNGEIRVKILKESGQCFKKLRDCINEDIKNSRFPNCLKEENIIPIFKKGDKTVKSNYRPISILPLLSKVYEKLLKTHSTQHALFKLLQAWKRELDNRSFVGTILINLSKAYDCLPHDLIIAKLEA